MREKLAIIGIDSLDPHVILKYRGDAAEPLTAHR